MTKEEYERQQSVLRRVFDPDTGRHRSATHLNSILLTEHLIDVLSCCHCRLVKGDGEIVEEIVSRERQKAINKVTNK